MSLIAPSATLAVEQIAAWARDHALDFRTDKHGESGAVLSPCGRYRYLLWRRVVGCWPFLSFGMLNPSTADHRENDPTIRRCIGFTRAGFSGPLVWNLFALRATSPDDMKAAEEPIGHLNSSAIDLALSLSAQSVAAWGTDGAHLNREHHVLRRVAALGYRLHALKLTKAGHPCHPLYLPRKLVPRPWDFSW